MRAIVVFPFADIMRNVVILFAVTLLLLSVTVYVLVLQIKSIVRQQHNLQEQQQNFYVLAEQMRLPVGEIVSEMPLEKWDFIEEKSSVLLGMTEETLSKAKAEALYESGHKRISIKNSLHSQYYRNIFIIGHMVRIFVSDQLQEDGVQSSR